MTQNETILFRALERIASAMWELHMGGHVQYRDPDVATRMEDAITFAQSAVASFKKGDHV